MIQIPELDTLSSELHSKEEAKKQEALTQQLVEAASSPEVIEDMGRKISAIALPDETPVDAMFLVRCLKNELQRRTDEKRDVVFMPHALRHRPKVFVASRKEGGGLAFIAKAEELEQLFSEITDISAEQTYFGHDHKEVIVLRCALPEGYVARVPYIMLKHVPTHYFQTDAVVVKRMPVRDNRSIGNTVLLCRELEPLWTDKRAGAFSQAEIHAAYGYITVKIRTEDHTIKSWFPGVDIHCGLCEGLEDEFVLIGPHAVTPRTQPHRQDKRKAANATLTVGQLTHK